ncbi:transposable element Tcb1 transposase [Trichonephila clavipes]|nr:transposable element Tcb1 transposase [Trichonephila clavipes]
MSARRPLLHLPLTGNHRRLHRQWCNERLTWTTEWDIVFTDESRFCLQHHDGRIRVWRHHGERLLNCCVMHRRNGPAPSIMVWGGIGLSETILLILNQGQLTRLPPELAAPSNFHTAPKGGRFCPDSLM